MVQLLYLWKRFFCSSNW